jgi:integrase
MASDTGLIPRNQESNPLRFVRCKTTSGYEAMILTTEQAYAVMLNLREPERTLTLLAAGTGLRISECLGLQWQDVSFSEAISMYVVHGRAAKWAYRRAKPQKVPSHYILYYLNSCSAGNRRRRILSRVIGCFPHSG